jgi:hypothetical protein
VIVLIALTRVLKVADTEAAAIRTLDRSVIVIFAVVGAWIAITQVSFAMIPINEWDGSDLFFVPFTFGSVDVNISPMVQT